MDVWFRKFLGHGNDVFLALRNMREDRFRLDPFVPAERAFLVIEHIDQGEVHLYLPPGNDLLAQHCGAVACPPPDLKSPNRALLSTEDIPVCKPLEADSDLL
ncbi:hypothetical protein [Pseudomonas sp.]|uniref:hypothetical protein n=1 Tax=Pseudomonas sp. TaxID=306 RepID=UPI00289D95C1|nr:hypothetical protein [Pseudomonas sp.]